MNDLEQVSGLKKWIIAIRPFGAILSVFPVLFGTWCAVHIGGAVFNGGLFTLALIAMFLLHHGSNLLNDFADYRRGVDQVVTPTSGAVTRQWLSPSTVLKAGIGMMLVGVALGLVIAWQVGPIILVLGAVGLFSGVCYTLGPRPLKYHGLGDLSVFISFGILGALGAWVVQMGSLSWVPALWSIPFSMLVVAVLHANNWRDIEGDQASLVTTVASILGEKISQRYYDLLIFGAYAITLIFLIAPRILGRGVAMPLSFALVFVSLPLAIKVHQVSMKRIKSQSPEVIIALDGQTAQLTMAFAVLSLAAMGLAVWVS